MQWPKRKHLAVALAATILLTVSGFAAWPQGGRTIRMILPFPPGGPADIMARDAAKAEALRTAIQQIHRDVRVEVVRGIEDAASGADGLVNATPLGMDGLNGTAFPHGVFARQR